jgi:hypothetical protein
MIAVVSLLIVVMVILIAARVATVALMATGLPREVARFQARSALTGVGFTTTESESAVSHPLRRRIVMMLMVVGNAGLVTIVASVMLSFVDTGESGRGVLPRLGLIAAGLAFIGLIARSQLFERLMTNGLARILHRLTELDLRDFHHLMQLSRDYAVTELQVRPGDWLASRKLVDLELPAEGVIVLAVQRADGTFLGAPRGGTEIHPYDTVILYGRSNVLSDLDARPATPVGDARHAEAAAAALAEIVAGEEHEDEGDPTGTEAEPERN